MIEISNFAELLQPCLELENKNVKVESYSTKNLVPFGENYGSVILAVEVKLSNGNVLQVVAKLNPESEMFKKIFNISIAFKKEANFYKMIVPILHNFQNECGVPLLESFATYYGSRLSLKPNEETFDEDACLVMENLKFQGFTSVDRVKSYDLPTSEYILRTLAHFHALPIALKLKKPAEFEKCKKHLPLNLTDPEIASQRSKRIIEMTKEFLMNDIEIVQFLEKIIPAMNHSLNNFVKMNVLGREPFNTITHNDVWISNILLKFDEQNRPIANRLVDYQMAAYGNPANDILFFMLTSINADIIMEKFDYLIDCYYEEFVRKLEEYQIDIGKFGKDIFLREVEDAAKNLQLYHILFVIVHVFLETKEPVTRSESPLKNDFTSDLTSSLNENYAKHLKSIIINYVKHNWV